MGVMYRESRKHPARQLTVSVGNLSTILNVTACTFQRRRILACEETHNLILDAWTQAPEWTVGRYVVMPDHVHLFAAENELQGYPLGQWVAKMEGTRITFVAIPKGEAHLAIGVFGIIS
jgi:putative transposase